MLSSRALFWISKNPISNYVSSQNILTCLKKHHAISRHVLHFTTELIKHYTWLARKSIIILKFLDDKDKKDRKEPAQNTNYHINIKNRIRYLCQSYKFYGGVQQRKCKERLTYKGTHRAICNLIRKIQNIFWNGCTDQKLSNLIAEIVAVVGKQTVCLCSIPRAYLLQIHFKDILWYVGDTQIYNFNRSPIWCRPSWSMLYTASKIIFMTINHYSCVPTERIHNNLTWIGREGKLLILLLWWTRTYRDPQENTKM